MKGTSLNIAFCSFELGLTQGKRVQLLPHGNFRSTDGRPEKIPHWTMNASIAAKLIEIVGERKNDLVIDFEHQTLMTAKNGQPAPAAGWFKEMEYEDGVGLFATDVRWVGDTEAMIAKEEYKYLSLVFPYDNNGVPLDIFHAGLTNAPAIDGMDDIQVMAAKFFSTE